MSARKARTFRPSLRSLGAAALVAMLAACGSEQGELTQWMEQQRRDAKPSVTPLTPPKRFDPQGYLASAAIAPFSSQKLAVAARQDAREPNPLLAAEMSRRREPLEAYPLDSMGMVGSLNKYGRTFALLRVDNLLYQVKVGDHLGQNYGRVTRITDSEVGLREVVQDAAGEWIERATSLQLQERGGGATR